MGPAILASARRPGTAPGFRRIKVEPLSPVIGAEISGVDLSQPLDAETIAEINAALLEHLVIFFHDQPIDFESHKRFGRYFGEMFRHPGATLAGNDGELIRIHADADSKVVAGEDWHSDSTGDPMPPKCSIFHMHQLPSCGGGDTQFTSAYAAYEGLSDRMKAYLEGLTAHHDAARVFGPAYANRPGGDKLVFPKADHPVVCRHQDTGRKLLFVNRQYTARINGLKPEESDAVLNYLFGQIGRPEYSTRFRWRRHSIALWDNRSVQHLAVWDYFPAERTAYRVTIRGTAPPTA